MKSTTGLLVTMVFAIAFSISLLSVRAQAPETEIDQAHMVWVEKCLADFQTIKAGMTRSQVEAKFPVDGGISSPSSGRYTHPACPYFKIDVTFAVQRDAAGRAITGKDDKVISISKPYLETPIAD